MDYITKDDTIIFSPNYNDVLDINLLSKYAKLIFSDNALSDKLFEAYENNNIDYFQSYQGSKFNQKINNLPTSLTHLRFGFYFNQKVNNLPQNLTHLTFGNRFNQEVNNLPQNLRYLTFGYYFNQFVDYLPSNIVEITFCYEFNQKIENLPISIQKIIFSTHSDYNIELNCLPNFLEFLQLPEKYDKKILNLPKELKTIKCSKNYEYLNDFAGYDVEYY